jgi:hypothetical protein
LSDNLQESDTLFRNRRDKKFTKPENKGFVKGSKFPEKRLLAQKTALLILFSAFFPET